MNLHNVVALLTDGAEEVSFTTHGSSMTPKIESGDWVTVERVDPATVKKGDIVLARVNGKFYLHLVSAVEKDRVQISNNHKHVNGWTPRSNVIARLRR